MTKYASRKNVFNKTNGRCSYCGTDLDPFDFHREHVIPQSRGGTGRMKNIVPSCNICNSRKRTKTLAEFRDYIRDYPIGLLDEAREHLSKYHPCLSNSEHLLGQIADKMYELRRLYLQLKPTFYIDNLDVEIFLDGDLENHHG